LSALHADGTTESVGPDRLPASVVISLRTDRGGRLWVASYGGLAVHSAHSTDGKNGGWQYADLEESAASSALFETRSGQWWVAGTGVSRRSQMPLSPVNPHVSAVDRLKRKVEASYPNVKPLRDLAMGSNGIVVGFADQRLFRYDGKKWEDLSPRLGKFDIYQIKADSKGTIWVATGGNGLIGLDPDGAIRRYNNDPESGASVIYSIDQTPDGTLYAGTQHGVYRLRGGTWEQVKSDLFQVGQVLVDRRGRVWMMEVTYNNLYVYDGRRFREVKQQTSIADLPLEFGSLRLDDAGNVLVDVPAQPGEHQPSRTFKWDATGENIGPVSEVH
jgi:ligand-binding sensor domain-containing protein